jgi:hypothetical protein
MYFFNTVNKKSFFPLRKVFPSLFFDKFLLLKTLTGLETLLGFQGKFC